MHPCKTCSLLGLDSVSVQRHQHQPASSCRVGGLGGIGRLAMFHVMGLWEQLGSTSRLFYRLGRLTALYLGGGHGGTLSNSTALACQLQGVM